MKNTMVSLQEWKVRKAQICPKCKSSEYAQVWSGIGDIYVMSCFSCDYETSPEENLLFK